MGVGTGNRQTNSKLGNVASGVNFELMMARREIYVYPMGELTVVRRLRVGVVDERFYASRLSWAEILRLLLGY
jgi:hypothetical protein